MLSRFRITVSAVVLFPPQYHSAWGKKANAAAGRVSFFADYFSNLIYFVIVECGVA